MATPIVRRLFGMSPRFIHLRPMTMTQTSRFPIHFHPIFRQVTTEPDGPHIAPGSGKIAMSARIHALPPAQARRIADCHGAVMAGLGYDID